MPKASFLAWRPSAAIATIVILLGGSVSAAFADLTASDLIAAMRFNDSILQQCVLEGNVEEKILPPPPSRPHIFQVAVAGGQDITELPGVDRLTELATKYGKDSGVSLDDVPAEYLPLVQLIRNDKITMKLVKDDRPELITHRNYGYILALHRGDVAFHKYGGIRPKDALAFATTTLGNKKSSLEYFAGTWERVDTVSKFPVNLFHENALHYCFALGVGFGDRVHSASVQTRSEGLYVVDAKISIWPGKLQDARLLIDDSGLVREADIECNFKRIRCKSGVGNITTEAGTKLASSGRVEVQSPKRRELIDLVVNVRNVNSGLENEDFLKLCNLSTSDEFPVYFYEDGYSSKRVLMKIPNADSSQEGF